MRRKDSVPKLTDTPVWWFARLDRAIADGDYSTAAVADAELRRLGVVVRFPRSPVTVGDNPVNGGEGAGNVA